MQTANCKMQTQNCKLQTANPNPQFQNGKMPTGKTQISTHTSPASTCKIPTPLYLVQQWHRGVSRLIEHDLSCGFQAVAKFCPNSPIFHNAPCLRFVDFILGASGLENYEQSEREHGVVQGVNKESEDPDEGTQGAFCDHFVAQQKDTLELQNEPNVRQAVALGGAKERNKQTNWLKYANHEMRITKCESQSANHKMRITKCESQNANHKMRIKKCALWNCGIAKLRIHSCILDSFIRSSHSGFAKQSKACKPTLYLFKEIREHFVKDVLETGREFCSEVQREQKQRHQHEVADENRPTELHRSRHDWNLQKFHPTNTIFSVWWECQAAGDGQLKGKKLFGRIQI